MSDYNNFFNDGGQEPDNRYYTPVYRTPEPDKPPQDKKKNAMLIVAIVAVVIMCVTMIINVVVLATLKTSIAEEYAAHMGAELKDKYTDAINDILDKEGIIDDIIDKATDGALDKIDTSVSELAVSNGLANSVAVINSTKSDGNGITGTGFLIYGKDVDSTATKRYLVTNAHVVLEEKAYSSSKFGTTYKFEEYPNIVAKFDNDAVSYKMKIVAAGAYVGDYSQGDIDNLPDLAVCEFVGSAPIETSHQSLAIDSEDATFGSSIALIGNPSGFGISITAGIISHSPFEFYDSEKNIYTWSKGEYYMTDAAGNPGNSGGPMIGRNLKVVGIFESKIVKDGIENMGFAVTSKTLINFLDENDIPYTTTAIA